MFFISVFHCMKFPSTRVIYRFLCYHVNWSYGGSIIVYHSLVYDFKVGPTNIYVLAMPMHYWHIFQLVCLLQ